MENEKNGLCEQYLRSAENDKEYYDLFFRMCRKFRVDWATASDREKEFVQEVVRVTYERSCAEKSGNSTEHIRPAFTA